MAEYVIKKLDQRYDRLLAAEELYMCLRRTDRQEAAALVDDVEQEVRSTLVSSDECYAAYDVKDRGLIAAWGLMKVKGQPGRLIWCLGTYRIERHWFSFAATSRRILQQWTRHYGRLYNSVATFNTDAIRWLKWCGATFHPTIPLGRGEFYPFEILKGESENV